MNLAAMRTQRSLAVMLLPDGSALLVYHGEFLRHSSISAGVWPTMEYQATATAWRAIWNGTILSTAAAVRLGPA